MNTGPIRPARIAVDGDGTPRSLDVDDIYHPREGAFAQARHVFLAGNGLPARWQDRERFVILETGFGLANNFLAAWAAWRDCPDRCRALVFISVEARPPTGETLASVPRDAVLAPLAQELADQWPPLTWNLHRLDFENGAVQLLLAFGDVAAWLPQIEAEVDAFFLDGFAPALNPAMWDPRLFKAMARLAAPGATAATWTAARSVRDGLRSAGFEVRSAPGCGAKRDITLARFAPPFAARRTPRRCAARPAAGSGPEAPIVIVGAGLAGCAVAAELAGHGRHTLLLERGPCIAGEGSGNPAGLVHGIVHAADSRHARFYRAAALAAQSAVERAIDADGVAGSLGGLLRLVHGAKGALALQALIEALGLPADYVQALDASAAGARAGVELASAAWYYPQGGWVDPGGLARSYLRRGAARVELRLGSDVRRLRRTGERWAVIDANGATIVESAVVVVANAGGALDLLGTPAWPIQSLRGQVTGIDVATERAPGWPRIPVAGAGYVLPPIEGMVWCGATSQAGDDDPAVRRSDHLENLGRLTALLGSMPRVEAMRLHGRTAFRWATQDRLPVIGAVPALQAGDLGRPDQPRLVPREAGLFVFTALGSRGIAASALGARILAAAITGAPSPVEADLLDAVDPARFQVRVFRRAMASDAGAASGISPRSGPSPGRPAAD